ncbi:MAG: peptidase M23 [Oceanospirillaceae bacterium]|nr:peptidase M23 [Oceanospirillaceae bacterium]|tara:strand:- start:638 stop:1924 length:1287 start_codon:yes stop_codon:yes gene_type:complete
MSTEKDLPGRLQFFPVTHIAGVIAIVVFLLIIFLLPSSSGDRRHKEQMTVSIPESATEADTQDAIQPAKRESDTIRSGDSLSVLFDRNNLSASDVIAIASAVPREALKLRPGQEISWTRTADGKVQEMDIQLSPLVSHRVTRTVDNEFAYRFDEKAAQRYPQYASATVNTSLFYDGNKAGVPEQVLINLAGIFGWDIDFALDIRKGDSFAIVYEEIWLNGEKIGNGEILAARFINQERTYSAIRYVDRLGNPSYYTPQGLSMRKEFLRNPIDFARISSRFNLRRKHPVLNKIRAHRGTDYAAPIGTPIKAAGDGKVTFAGRKGGYGNVIIIQHGARYQTLYAHMNGFHRSIRRGRKVRQGQIIGYVGTTGMSTGPHLHYEFRVDGVHRDSLKVKLPKAKPIAKVERPRFFEQARALNSVLDNIIESER